MSKLFRTFDAETNKFMAITHIDCFAGPGGICTGLHAAGIQTLVAIEYIKSCCDTYRINHPEVRCIQSDIREIKKGDIKDFIPQQGVDLVTSGMPCETFSTAGNSSRSFYDERQFLFREGIRIAKMCKAKMILFENVPGITSKKVSEEDSTLIIDVLKQELLDAGYKNYIEVTLDATKFGVPQKRNRYFILACRFKKWRLTPPVGDVNRQIVTVADALKGLPNVIPNSGIEGRHYEGDDSFYSSLMKNDVFWRRQNIGGDRGIITSHLPMKHREPTLRRFSMLRPGEGLKGLFDRLTTEEKETLQQERVLPKKMFIKRNQRLILDEPSPTVTSHCLDEFVHPIYHRALTVRECARLQSFPDSYIFEGPYLVPHIDRTTQDRYEQIGDAVPPLLAYAWGCKISEIFNQYDR